MRLLNAKIHTIVLENDQTTQVISLLTVSPSLPAVQFSLHQRGSAEENQYVDLDSTSVILNNQPPFKFSTATARHYTWPWPDPDWTRHMVSRGQSESVSLMCISPPQFTNYIYINIPRHHTIRSVSGSWAGRVRQHSLDVDAYVLFDAKPTFSSVCSVCCACAMSSLIASLDLLHRPYGCPYPPLPLGRCTITPRGGVNCQPLVTLSFSSIWQQPLIQPSAVPQRKQVCLRARPPALWLFLPCGSPPRHMHFPLDGPPPLSPWRDRLGFSRFSSWPS